MIELFCLVSRLSADTQVVQEGLSQSVAMGIKGSVVVVAMCGIMFSYNWKMAIAAVALMMPHTFSFRLFWRAFVRFNEQYASSKGVLGSFA